MRFAMLGPLEVCTHGGPISLGGPKQRALLAILLLHANETVSRDRLIDGLWGDAAPPSASTSLDAYVYRLRNLLGRDRMARHGPGYVLRVDAGELDVTEFERLLAEGRAAAQAEDAQAAVRHLTEALALWRGPALADFSYEAFALAEIARLEAARLAATEDLLDAELQLGLAVEIVPRLEQLVRLHPLRERFVAALMLALYRAGRQADALAAYRAAYRRFVDELGIQPEPATRDLHRRILQHDPELLARVPSGPAHRKRVTGVRAAAGALAVVAVAAAVLVVGSAAAHSALPTLGGANGVVGFTAASGRIVAATPLAGAPGAVASCAGSVWVADAGAGDVDRIDADYDVPVDQIAVGGEPGSIVCGAGAVWVASTVGATVVRIDPGTEAVTQTITLSGDNLGAIAYGAGQLWVADPVDHELFEIDARTGTVLRTVPVDVQPTAIAVAGGAVWVAGYNTATVEKLDQRSGLVVGRVRVGDGPVALAFQAGTLWVANSLDSTVSGVDPGSLKVKATIPVGSGPSALGVGSGSVWVANQYSGTVSRIAPSSDRVTGQLVVVGAPTSLAVTRSRVWAAVAATSSRHRGGTLMIVTPASFDSAGPSWVTSADPAFYDGAGNPQFTGLAYDSLVSFQQSTGADGLRLVPDLALAIPAAANHGTVYSFRIRPGIRYSDGQVVRAGDFRRGIERLFRVGSPGTTLYADIKGAGACLKDPSTCDLSSGIVTDNAARTVTFHLTAPDADFLFSLTEDAFGAPIPAGTPDHEPRSRAVPGTGPYEIASISATQVRFIRNPYFREWSHAAQPAGNPDSIVWQRVPTIAAAVSDVEQGRADWVYGQLTAAEYQQLELQDPAELHSNPQFAVEFVPLNTHLAPFNDVRVRQALNYAINRAEMVQLYGGPNFATPTCQPIAPGLPGYVPYCPYTLHPSAAGAWSAPDMARARQLVAASGTLGERVDIWGSPDEGFIPPTATAYVASVLRALGYHVYVHVVPFASITEAMWRRMQISVDGDWLANYPDPSSYLPLFFACDGGNSNGYYCNPALDDQMQRAEELELTNPPESRAIWAAIDRELTDDAVWVPTATMRDVEVTSRRLHNYQYNPVWGFLADQSWLR